MPGLRGEGSLPAEMTPDHPDIEALRREDPDRFLASLFAPPPARPALWTLYALNQELGRIPEIVSEQMIGEIRLQWWRERLPGMLAGEGPDHPLAPGLAELGKGGLALADLEPLIDGRVRDLDPAPPADRAELEERADQVAGTLCVLAARLLDDRADAPDALQVARQAGRVWGLVGLMRALPHRARRGVCLLPRELLAAHGASADDVLAGRWAPPLQGAVFAVLQRAEEIYRDLKAQVSSMPRASLPAVLYVPSARLYARRLTDGADPFRQPAALAVPAFRRQLAYLRVALTGRL